MQEQPAPSPEIVIRGRYVLEGLLGKSSAGATYLVRDQQSGTRNVPGKLFVLKELIEPIKQARRRPLSERSLVPHPLCYALPGFLSPGGVAAPPIGIVFLILICQSKAVMPHDADTVRPYQRR